MVTRRQVADRNALLTNPNADDARVYYRKYRHYRVAQFSDIGLLGGLHKARIKLGIGVDESAAWLLAHDMTLDIPDEFLENLQ